MSSFFNSNLLPIVQSTVNGFRNSGKFIFLTKDAIQAQIGVYVNNRCAAKYSFNANFGKFLKANDSALGIVEIAKRVPILDKDGRRSSCSEWAILGSYSALFGGKDVSKKTLIVSSGSDEQNLTIEDAWTMAKDVLQSEIETLDRDYEDKLGPDGYQYTDYDCDCDPNEEDYTCDRCSDSALDEVRVSNGRDLTAADKLTIAKCIFERNGYKVQIV